MTEAHTGDAVGSQGAGMGPTTTVEVNQRGVATSDVADEVPKPCLASVLRIMGEADTRRGLGVETGMGGGEGDCTHAKSKRRPPRTDGE